MKQKLKLLLSVVFYFSYVISFAQYKLTDPVPINPDVKVGKLSNGLIYYIQKNVKPEKKVELRLVVNAGSVQENESQLGLAHFMEHMGFNGSKNFPKNELVDYLQKTGVKFGADLNAYTSFDETVYILPIPSDVPEILEKGFTVLEDWAFNNLFDADEIEKERGVVLEESRLSKGSWERMSRQYFPRLFNGSIYADRLPIGKDEVLKNFKHETLKKFYKDWYRPDLMAVVVVGDIDPADVEKKIIAHFGKYKSPANAPARPAIIPIKQRTSAEAMVLTDEEATNTTIEIYNFVKPAKKIKTWKDYRENIIEGLVSSLINQRLSELTQKENPPFLFANTGFSPFLRGYNSFTSFAVVGKEPVQNVIDVLIAETNRARQFGFLPAELDRVKASLLNSAEKAFLEKDKSESGQIVWQYVNNYLENTPVPGVMHRHKFLQQTLPLITLQEVNAVAKEMPSVNNAFALVQAPDKVKETLPDNKRLLSYLVEAAKKPVNAYEEKVVSSKLLDKEPVAGKITAETKNEKLGTTNITLSNGTTVTLKPTTNKNDEILMDAWRWGGFQKFELADKENAQYAARIVRETGISDMPVTDIRKFLAGKTVVVSPYINAHEEGIEGSSSIKDFETFLQLMYLYFTEPRKDEGLFKSFITKNKASLEFLKQDPMTSYQDTVTKIIYNNHPWAQVIPTPENYDRINYDRSFEIYKNLFGNVYGMHFTFVGNIDPNTIKPLLEKYIGSLPSSPKENMYKDNGLRMIPGLTEGNIKRGKEEQSLITLKFEGEAVYSPKEKLTLAALLEVMNIKIIEKLREEMSGIYGGGMFGNLLKRPYEYYSITASMPCGPENAEKLTTALADLIKDAQEKGIEEKDLEKVKETWKKQYHVNLQNNNFWRTNLSQAWIDRNDPENILDYEKNVNNLSVEDLQKAAKKYLTLNNMAKFIMYPENSNVTEGVKTLKPF